jgi:hypothetical protein
MPPVAKTKVDEDGLDVSDEDENEEDGQMSAARCVPSVPFRLVYAPFYLCVYAWAYVFVYMYMNECVLVCKMYSCM